VEFCSFSGKANKTPTKGFSTAYAIPVIANRA
jgi:hypothetical protein